MSNGRSMIGLSQFHYSVRNWNIFQNQSGFGKLRPLRKRILRHFLDAENCPSIASSCRPTLQWNDDRVVTQAAGCMVNAIRAINYIDTYCGGCLVDSLKACRLHACQRWHSESDEQHNINHRRRQDYVAAPPISRGAKYCDERVCLSVCLCFSVCSHIFGTTHTNVTTFSAHVACAGHGSVLLWRRWDTLCTGWPKKLHKFQSLYLCNRSR